MPEKKLAQDILMEYFDSLAIPQLNEKIAQYEDNIKYHEEVIESIKIKKNIALVSLKFR